MKLRIISGLYGGRSITAPDTDATHPMSERVRNAMFNIISSDIKGASVLDAFAGSGAVGIEAMSRGAAHATFIERDRKASDALSTNIELFGLGSQATCVHGTVEAYVRSETELFDIIFVDPPYDDMQLSTAFSLTSLLQPNGLMVLSYPGRGEAPTGTNGVVVVDNRSYGTAALAFYRKKDA
jgi:16S rRNA (guanine966-N2)-methyltransferase